MSIETKPPTRDMDTFRDRLNRMMSEFESWPFELWERLPLPVDMKESEEEIVVMATMPSIRAEDIEIDVRDGALHIRHESQEGRDESEGTWHRRERRLGSVARMIMLPSQVDPARAEAVLQDGVLTVKLPKQEPTPSRKISVRTP